jgi:outer membrane murein-binding lipoprotein Lpp
MKSKILLFAVLLSITFFMGCNNEPVNESATSNSITTDETIVNSEIDATVDDLSIIAEDQFDMQKSSAAKTSAGMKSMLPPCATVTAVLTNETWTRTIDFGTQGCAMPNGNILKGKIIISFSKNFTTPIRTISYKLEGFYHNDKLIEGSKTITHELKTSDLLATVHPVTTHSIDVKITYPDGKIYSRVGTRVREMVEGFATMTNWEDNVFNVWGYHITTFPNGSVYTCTIKTPLLIKMSCKMPFPVSGVVEIVKNDSTATLDYGNGDCDKLATITVNGVTKEIVIRK